MAPHEAIVNVIFEKAPDNMYIINVLFTVLCYVQISKVF